MVKTFFKRKKLSLGHLLVVCCLIMVDSKDCRGTNKKGIFCGTQIIEYWKDLTNINHAMYI